MLISPGSVMDPTINTVDGKLFSYKSMDFKDLTIEGLAAALAKICRFTGHCTEFYSVAEHCLIASYLVPRNFALAALAHDLHEAVMGDMNSPLKACLPEYKTMERRAENALRYKFGISTDPMTKAIVKQADTFLYLAEREKIMPQLSLTHPEHGYIPLPVVGSFDYGTFIEAQKQIKCYSWQVARDLYLTRWKELTQ